MGWGLILYFYVIWMHFSWSKYTTEDRKFLYLLEGKVNFCVVLVLRIVYRTRNKRNLVSNLINFVIFLRIESYHCIIKLY